MSKATRLPMPVISTGKGAAIVSRADTGVCQVTLALLRDLSRKLTTSQPACSRVDLSHIFSSLAQEATRCPSHHC